MTQTSASTASSVGTLVSTLNWDETRDLVPTFVVHRKVLYFGRWLHLIDEIGDAHASNTQFNAFEFSFTGSVVRWIGSRRPSHGCADVYLDGKLQATVDAYAPEAESDVVKFERTDIAGDRIHTLRVVVRKDRNPEATDCWQDVTRMESASLPVVYPVDIARARDAEYARIRAGEKPYAGPETWRQVPLGATAPSRGVRLKAGPLRDVFERNIGYLEHCFASPTKCDGIGWSDWLPASNDGRMLSGAANTLRWGERPQMRRIVDTITAGIADRMRPDGYYNYYPEADSYALNSGINSERKNYDRVFWTRGLLAAGLVGADSAYESLRGMYDWFNASPYLGDLLMGSNATNGLPGGPLAYLSPVGKPADLITTLRYYDQDYWFKELSHGEPLAMTYYPGERPHCYALLGFEALADEYRATGDAKYLDALRGGWQLYRDNFKHVGGATAIMEHYAVCPPQNYYMATTLIGEACGSVFWIDINSRLLQLFPEEEKYAAEIEESIFNVILAAQDKRGYIRYHNVLEGHKREPGCRNTCCEVSSVGLIARLPEFVYSVAEDGIFVNQFVASDIAWDHAGQGIRLSLETDFPNSPAVAITVSTGVPTRFKLRIRVPSWATGEMEILVNGTRQVAGRPGSYVAIEREWADGDRVSFELPAGLRTVQYRGLEQAAGNLDRHALLYGPILLALTGEGADEATPRLRTDAAQLPALLSREAPQSLDYRVEGYPKLRYRPYWQLDQEAFCCYPIVQR